MLSTQVDYWKLIETRRHNQRDEELANMSNQENIRHNKEVEKENIRHNEAQEFLTSVQLQESKRHNVAGEGISAATVSESRRHNLESEDVARYSAQSGAVKDVATKSSAVLNDVTARTKPLDTVSNVFSGAFKVMNLLF